MSNTRKPGDRTTAINNNTNTVLSSKPPPSSPQNSPNPLGLNPRYFPIPPRPHDLWGGGQFPPSFTSPSPDPPTHTGGSLRQILEHSSWWLLDRVRNRWQPLVDLAELLQLDRSLLGDFKPSSSVCSVSALKENILFMEAASVDFEVFGKVQGCNFTKVAKEHADRLGLTGWVKNNKTGTVGGRLQGAKASVDEMVKWLSEEGSPGCQIDECKLSNQQAIIRPDYPKFVLKF